MRKIVVLNPSDPDPTFGLADDARIVEVADGAALSGPAIKSAIESGMLVAHPIGKRVGKRVGKPTAAAPAEPTKPAAKTPPPSAKK